jgi:hypothetical protein
MQHCDITLDHTLAKGTVQLELLIAQVKGTWGRHIEYAFITRVQLCTTIVCLCHKNVYYLSMCYGKTSPLLVKPCKWHDVAIQI